MPFIGNQPALSYTSFAKQDFTTSATTSYTLDNPVTNANELALFINFVRQEPTTAYSASGTSLTLTSATSASDDMYCVFLGKAVQTVNPPNASVGLSQLTATGTKDATTFLRGDNTFAAAGSPSIDDNGNATAITIDSSENVGIGTASPTDTNGFGKALDIQGSTGAAIYVGSSGDRGIFGYASGEQHIINPSASGTTRFNINGAERMRIDSSGTVLIGKTSAAVAVQGHAFGVGDGAHTSTSTPTLYINRLGSEGELINFYHSTTQEGSISVAGATVSYNGFTGTHWSRFTDNSTPTILKGTVLETLDEMCDWYNLEFDITTTTQDEDGNDVTETHTEIVPHVLADGQSVGDVITYNHEGTDYQATIVKEGDVKHMMSKVSDTTDAKNVYGVFIDYDNDGDGYNDFYVASVGSFVVRIKSGETVAKGDLLQSNGDGTAKVQSDDNIKSSSFAKVLSTTIIETYEDGSYLVPCSLMC